MSSVDYYKILGVEKRASQDEIKGAFRKLAMEHHPDRNEGDAHAESKFKEANEAYAVLSDAEKRRKYDAYGADGFKARFSQDDIFGGFDFSRVFEEMGMGGRFGGTGGRGFNPFGGQRQQAPRRGESVEQEMTIGFHEAFSGAERSLQVASPSGREDISVKIPAGITSGKKLRVRKKGQPGSGGGPPGDLFLKIQVADHPIYRLKGRNVEMTAPLPLTTLLLGGSFVVMTPNGEERTLRIPPLTPNGTRMRIRGEGFPEPRLGVGDLLVRIVVDVPEEITEEQEAHFKALRDLGL